MPPRKNSIKDKIIRRLRRITSGRKIAIHGRYGLELAIDPEIVSPRITEEIRRGTYESLESAHILSAVQPTDHVLELGAGLGFIASLIQTSKPVAQYTAVEANPKLIPLIKETLRINNAKVEVINAIASTLPEEIAIGSVPFVVEPEFWASRKGGQGDRVKAIDFNALIKERGISLIIVDIEGGEADLFQYADLKGVRRICVEIHPDIGKAKIQRLFETLHRLDFVYDGRTSIGTVVMFAREVA
jgi:FkbM family methyltransferase